MALKNAIDEGKYDTGDDEFVFLGATSDEYRGETYLEEGVLKASGKAAKMFLQTSNGKYDYLDPQVFDAVVLYGSYNHLQTLLASILKAGREQTKNYSSTFLHRGAREWLLQQPTIATIKGMRKFSDVPLILFFEPFYSERYKDQMPKHAEITQEQRDIIFNALREVVTEAGAICVFQPEETIKDPYLFPTRSFRWVYAINEC